jgi:hypothetical protein
MEEEYDYGPEEDEYDYGPEEAEYEEPTMEMMQSEMPNTLTEEKKLEIKQKSFSKVIEFGGEKFLFLSYIVVLRGVISYELPGGEYYRILEDNKYDIKKAKTYIESREMVFRKRFPRVDLEEIPECLICAEDIEWPLRPIHAGCGHVVCHECAIDYFQQQIRNGRDYKWLSCISKKCEYSFGEAEVISCLTEEEYNKWIDFWVSDFVNIHPEFLWCTNDKGCEHVIRVYNLDEEFLEYTPDITVAC